MPAVRALWFSASYDPQGKTYPVVPQDQIINSLLGLLHESDSQQLCYCIFATPIKTVHYYFFSVKGRRGFPS